MRELISTDHNVGNQSQRDDDATTSAPAAAPAAGLSAWISLYEITYCEVGT